MATISGLNFTPNPGTTNSSLSMVGSLSGLNPGQPYYYNFMISPAEFNVTPSSGSFNAPSNGSFNLESLNVIGTSSSPNSYYVTFNLRNLAGIPVSLEPAGGNQKTITINGPPSPPGPPPCFKEDTQILTFNSDLEKE
jgi:hypothetical protein